MDDGSEHWRLETGGGVAVEVASHITIARKAGSPGG
jgi:hypothetical protein